MEAFEFAGIVFGFKTASGYSERFCADYAVSKPVDIILDVSDDEVRSELNKQKAGTFEEHQSICIYRKIAATFLSRSGFLLHASAVKLYDSAYVFTAPSGTGKSTHAMLWRKAFGDNVSILNDDKPLIRKVEGEYRAFGTPWSGKSALNYNDSAVIKGAFLLSQAKNNSALPMSKQKAFLALMSECLRPNDADKLEMLSDTLWDFVDKVPMYALECTISLDAAVLAYNIANEV